MPGAAPAGKYSERIDIEAQVLPQPLSPSGQPGDHWSAVYLGVPCAVVTLAGDKRLFGEQLQTEASHRIELRSRPGLTSKMRAIWRGRHLYFRFVHDDAGPEIWITALEVAE